jgi:hypothetical protein
VRYVIGNDDAAFELSAVLSKHVRVVVVDVDEYGVQLVRDLRTVFPEVRVLALSNTASLRAAAKRSGAAKALPRTTPYATVKKTALALTQPVKRPAAKAARSR